MEVSIGTLLREYKQRLEAAGVLRPLEEAKSIIGKFMDLDSQSVDEFPHTMVNANKNKDIDDAIALREKRVPLRRIFETILFCDIKIKSTPDTFGPYPETEAIVDHAINLLEHRKDNARILDLGTGTGCILLAILHALPRASGTGVDINENITSIAQSNANINGLQDRALFRVSNWGEDITEKFDLIISNPPRVARTDIPHLIPEMRNHDPHISLDGGDDGLDFMRRTAKEFDRLAKIDGLGIFQVGPKHVQQVMSIFQHDYPYYAEAKYNFMGLPCCVVVKRKSKAPITLGSKISGFIKNVCSCFGKK